MEPRQDVIRAIDVGASDAFFSYLEDQLLDNGRNGVALFQPQSRDTPWRALDKIEPFRAGLAAEVGAPNWRRAWAAFDSTGAISGHVDLRSHGQPCTSHRALLGIGVHRDHRRRGLGKALVGHAMSWAQRTTGLEWIDLDFLGGNLPAERLYRSVGFQDVATVEDMFRIDGESIHNVIMSKRIRP